MAQKTAHRTQEEAAKVQTRAGQYPPLTSQPHCASFTKHCMSIHKIQQDQHFYLLWFWKGFPWLSKSVLASYKFCFAVSLVLAPHLQASPISLHFIKIQRNSLLFRQSDFKHSDHIFCLQNNLEQTPQCIQAKINYIRQIHYGLRKEQ